MRRCVSKIFRTGVQTVKTFLLDFVKQPADTRLQLSGKTLKSLCFTHEILFHSRRFCATVPGGMKDFGAGAGQ
jgi:hypothetical protein